MGTKGWKFWVLFVAVPIVVILSASLTFYGLQAKKKPVSKRMHGLQQGLIFAKLNRHTEAIAEFKRELEKNPENPDVYFHLGNSHLMLKEYDNAQTAIKNALKLKPDFSEAHYQLAIIKLARADELRKLSDSESIVLERLLEIEDICRDLIEKDKNFVKAYSLLGEIHVSQGLLDDAIKVYKQLLDLDNAIIDPHVELAKLYLKKGELDLAEKECDLILSELDPDNIAAMFVLTTIYDQTGKHDEAIAVFKQILEKEPESRKARIKLGLTYLKLSKYDEALAEAEYLSREHQSAQPATVHYIKGYVWLHRKDYEKAVSFLQNAIKIKPEMMEPHYFLAQTMVSLGHTQEAISEFKTAIKLAPTFIPAKMSLARHLSMIGGWQGETVNLCKDIIDINPEHVAALQMLGFEYVKKQDFENAELQFRRILELDPLVGEIGMAYLSLYSGQLSRCIRQCEAIISDNPDEPMPYNILGLAHIKRGNYDSGIEQYKKALEIDPKSTTTLMNLAKAYVGTGKNEEAKEALKNVITIDPGNLHPRVVLAGVHIKDGNVDEAAELLKHVIEVNPDNLKGYALAGIYLLQGKIDASIELCKKALNRFPDNTTLCFNLAVSYQQKERYGASIKYGEKLIELNPERSSLKIVLANNYAANGEFINANERIGSISSFSIEQKKAYNELLDLCQLNIEKGRQAVLALNRAMFARRVGLFDLAIIECKRAVDIFPENLVAKVMLASNYLSTNRHEDAIELYTEIIKDKPGFASSYYDLGRAYLLTDKEDEAISMFQDLIELDSKSVAGRFALVGTLVNQGKAAKAVKMIEDVIELDPGNLVAHDLLGKLSLAAGNYERAEAEFSKMIELNRDSFAGHFNMAGIKFVQGDFDTSIKHGKSAIETRPTDIQALYILGQAYLKKGWIREAASEFNKIIDINSDFVPAYLELANMSMAGKRPDIAANIYKAALKVKPETVDARLGLGNSYVLMRDFSKAIAEFDSVINEHPDNVNGYISLAGAYIVSDNDDKAQEAVMNALSLDPDNTMAQCVLSKLFIKKDEIKQAILQLEQALPGNPKMLSLYELGILYMDVEDYEKAIQIFKQGVENFPENSLMWCNLAVAYQMNKDFENARDACDKAMDIKPDSIIPNLCMLYIHMARGKYESARRHLEGKLNIPDVQKEMYFDLFELCKQNKEVSDKVSYHFSRAIAYINYEWFKRVLSEYDKVIEIVPTNTVAYKEKLDLLKRIGDLDNAILVCKALIELNPENPALYNKLAGIYYSKGEVDEALSVYREAVNVDPDNSAAHMGMGALLESKDLFEESVSAYEKVIELNPTYPLAYNNLAWVYASKMNGKLKEALKLAEKAKELDPNDPAISDTLGWIYYMDAKYDKAVPLLKAAVQNGTWRPTRHYHLGMAYYKNGLQEEAMAELQRALKISNTFPEAEEAKEVVEKIMLSKVNDTDNSLQKQDSPVSIPD